MIAFFFTMPIRSTMPMMATTPRSLPKINSASSAATPAAGNWPMWLTTSGEACSEMRAMAVSGTCIDACELTPDELADDVVPAPGAANAADALLPVVGTDTLAVGERELVAGT